MVIREGKKGRDAKLTRTIEIKHPFWGGWVSSSELGICMMYIPVNVIEDLVKLLLGGTVDADNLLNLPRLIYAHEYLQNVLLVKFQQLLMVKTVMTDAKEITVELKVIQSTH